jgi:Zn-dependent protease
MPDATSQSSWLADVSLTHDARTVMQRAGSIAVARGLAPEQSDSLDVLQALLQTRGTLAERSLRTIGVDPAAALKLVPARDGAPTVASRQVLLNAFREAQGLGHQQVDSVHLLVALLYTDSRTTSVALQNAGVTLYDLRRSLQASTVPTNHGGATRVEPRAATALRRKPVGSLRRDISISPIFLGLVAVTAGAGVALWLDLFPNALGATLLVFVVGGWVISLCVHEFCHAAVAYMGGDTSVAHSGYLSLNPLRYTDPFRSMVLPIAFLLLGGIGLPGGAVYINHSAIRSRAWDSAVSLAGPVGTLFCALLIVAVFVAPGHEGWITETNYGFFAGLAFLGFIQVSALVLNLIPIPGLDGFGIIAPWLSDSVRLAAYRLSTITMIALFVAIWYLPPARSAYFQTVLTLSALVNIDQNLVFVAFSQLPHF